MSIDGKVILVTGAGQGIGRAIALRLAQDGGHIAVVDINDSNTGAVAKEVRGIGRKATTFKADVTKREDVYAAVDHTEQELGGFDIMINNAGIAQVQPLADVSEITGTPIGQTYKKYVEGIALGRAQTPEDVAAFVSFWPAPTRTI